MLGIDLGSLVRALLFLLFADLTAFVVAVIGPMYDQLLVPELSPSMLYPSLLGPAGGSGGFLSAAARFSAYTLASVVDPAASLLALGVALLYLARPITTRWAALFDGLLPRLVLGVVGANFAVLIAGAVLAVGGALYPVLAGWDGGDWHQWVRLAGWGEVSFSWDNGALAFVLAIVEFVAVFALVLAIGVRDAMLAVLLVLLPIFTLLWPIRPLSPLARRAWFLFGELVFLPCVLVIPLELAVGSPNPVALVGFLAVAVASPFLLSLAGTQLVAFGLPGAGSTVHGSVGQGFAAAPSAATAHAAPVANAARGSGAAGRAAAGAVRAAGSAAAPVAAPLAAAELVGHGALHLLRHLPRRGENGPTGGSWGPVRRGGAR